MTTGRAFETVTRLQDGKVLIVGGLASDAIDATTVLASAEVYDPATGKDHAVGSLHTARYQHFAALLNDGRVLIAGGYNAAEANLRSTEVFDPATGIFSVGPDMPWTDREPCAAVTLKDGRVLFAGAWSIGSFPINSALVYNPSTKAFASISMPQSQCTGAQVVLPSGKVLLAGGKLKNAAGTKTTSMAEIFNPTTNTFSVTGSMGTPRNGLALTMIASTMVLASGGQNASGTTLATAEVYSPGPGTWSATAGPMASPRAWHTGTLLVSGKVLIAGGAVPIPVKPCPADPAAELFDPYTKSFANTGKTVQCRNGHAALRLNVGNGQVLVVGGGAMIGLHGQDNTMELYWP